jgi:hypothetical protein
MSTTVYLGITLVLPPYTRSQAHVPPRATDGPEMMRTHLRDEFELLLRIGALDEDEAREANARGHESAFARSLRVGERA